MGCLNAEGAKTNTKCWPELDTADEKAFSRESGERKPGDFTEQTKPEAGRTAKESARRLLNSNTREWKEERTLREGGREEKNNVKEDSKEQAISRQESEGRKNEHRLTDTDSRHALPRTRKPEKPISPKIGHTQNSEGNRKNTNRRIGQARSTEQHTTGTCLHTAYREKSCLPHLPNSRLPLPLVCLLTWSLLFPASLQTILRFHDQAGISARVLQ